MEKAYDIIHLPFMIKTPIKVELNGKYVIIWEILYDVWQLTSIQGWKDKTYSCEIMKKTRVIPLTTYLTWFYKAQSSNRERKDM